jgi:hypothetical protein
VNVVGVEMVKKKKKYKFGLSIKRIENNNNKKRKE